MARPIHSDRLGATRTAVAVAGQKDEIAEELPARVVSSSPALTEATVDEARPHAQDGDGLPRHPRTRTPRPRRIKNAPKALINLASRWSSLSRAVRRIGSFATTLKGDSMSTEGGAPHVTGSCLCGGIEHEVRGPVRRRMMLDASPHCSIRARMQARALPWP